MLSLSLSLSLQSLYHYISLSHWKKVALRNLCLEIYITKYIRYMVKLTKNRDKLSWLESHLNLVRI